MMLDGIEWTSILQAMAHGQDAGGIMDLSQTERVVLVRDAIGARARHLQV
jgi:hypothetical protein